MHCIDLKSKVSYRVVSCKEERFLDPSQSAKYNFLILGTNEIHASDDVMDMTALCPTGVHGIMFVLDDLTVNHVIPTSPIDQPAEVFIVLAGIQN